MQKLIISGLAEYIIVSKWFDLSFMGFIGKCFVLFVFFFILFFACLEVEDLIDCLWQKYIKNKRDGKSVVKAKTSSKFRQ